MKHACLVPHSFIHPVTMTAPDTWFQIGPSAFLTSLKASGQDKEAGMWFAQGRPGETRNQHPRTQTPPGGSSPHHPYQGAISHPSCQGSETGMLLGSQENCYRPRNAIRGHTASSCNRTPSAPSLISYLILENIYYSAAEQGHETR